jgi:hypothetical protein
LSRGFLFILIRKAQTDGAAEKQTLNGNADRPEGIGGLRVRCPPVAGFENGSDRF